MNATTANASTYTYVAFSWGPADWYGAWKGQPVDWATAYGYSGA